MNPRRLLLPRWLLVLGLAAALPLAHGADSASLVNITDGRVLAAELRARLPQENIEHTGSFEIRGRNRPSLDVPIHCLIRLRGDDAWEAVYETRPGPTVVAERLVVLHRAGQSNQYSHARAAGPGQPLPRLEPRALADTYIPFAGSDFWLADLGLEFFHWPEQKIAGTQMRKSRSCKILESRPAPGCNLPYSRVLSWIDNETGGLVIAEAYGPDNRRLKEFEVKSFEKVNGFWQLQRMQIQNLQDRSRTLLEFDLNDKPASP